MAGKDTVSEILKSKKGKTINKDGIEWVVIPGARGQIIFHNKTNGGVEFLNKRAAAKKIDALES